MILKGIISSLPLWVGVVLAGRSYLKGKVAGSKYAFFAFAAGAVAYSVIFSNLAWGIRGAAAWAVFSLEITAIYFVIAFLGELSYTFGELRLFALLHLGVTLLVMTIALAANPAGIAGGLAVAPHPDEAALAFGLSVAVYLAGYGGLAAWAFFRLGRDAELPSNRVRAWLLGEGMILAGIYGVSKAWTSLGGAAWSTGVFPGSWDGFGQLLLGVLGLSVLAAVGLPRSMERAINEWCERVDILRYVYRDLHNALAAIDDRMPAVWSHAGGEALRAVRHLCAKFEVTEMESWQVLEATAIYSLGQLPSPAPVTASGLVSQGQEDPRTVGHLYRGSYFLPQAFRHQAHFYAGVGRMLEKADRRYDGADEPGWFKEKGQALPLGSRILRVVGYWFSHRQDSHGVEEYLRREKGRTFDPAVVDEFLAYLRDERATEPR